MKRSAFLAGTAAAVTSAGGSALAQTPGPYAQQSIVAVCAPFSGELADFGEQLRRGALTACYESNRDATPLDRVFDVRTYDDRNAVATAALAAQFAINDPTCFATVGHLTGAITNSVLPYYNNALMPLIVPASTFDPITSHGYRNVFRLPTKDSVEGRLFAQALAHDVKPQLAIALTQDGDYGFEVARGFADQAHRSGFPAQIVTFSQEKPAYDKVAHDIVATKADYVFLAGNSVPMGPIVPALRKAGYQNSFGASAGFYTTLTLEKYADALGSASIVSTSMPPVERIPAFNTYVTDMRTRFGQVTPLMTFGFAAAQLAIAAVKRINSTTRLSLAQALENSAPFDGLLGTYEFSFNGDPIDPNLYFYSIENGAFVYRAAAHPASFIVS
ncbi:MAG: ABC transporter substrate-binding protein [Candidatus Eremiobacteraeota bacterium]|nr:ABC transporter substrate-binding protein [Candidatus Eremiobacteraeota bacterium]